MIFWKFTKVINQRNSIDEKYHSLLLKKNNKTIASSIMMSEIIFHFDIYAIFSTRVSSLSQSHISNLCRHREKIGFIINKSPWETRSNSNLLPFDECIINCCREQVWVHRRQAKNFLILSLLPVFRVEWQREFEKEQSSAEKGLQAKFIIFRIFHLILNLLFFSINYDNNINVASQLFLSSILVRPSHISHDILLNVLFTHSQLLFLICCMFFCTENNSKNCFPPISNSAFSHTRHDWAGNRESSEWVSERIKNQAVENHKSHIFNWNCIDEDINSWV